MGTILWGTTCLMFLLWNCVPTIKFWSNLVHSVYPNPRCVTRFFFILTYKNGITFIFNLWQIVIRQFLNTKHMIRLLLYIIVNVLFVLCVRVRRDARTRTRTQGRKRARRYRPESGTKSSAQWRCLTVLPKQYNTKNKELSHHN